MKAILRRLVPQPALNAYHLALARLADLAYGRPSQRLTVVGVTGTNGKSSTVQFTGQLLEAAGYRVGWTTTDSFKVAEREWANDKKMTMLGRFATQRLLRDMVRAGCTHAVVETSSQGIAQFRHAGIRYDVAAFTNLTPEHIEAHGGFENYKRAKGRLFSHLGPGGIAVVNADDPHAGYFFSFPARKRYGFGLSANATVPKGTTRVVASQVSLSPDGATFSVEDVPTEGDARFIPIATPLLGRFNVYNVLAALSICRSLGVPWDALRDGAARLRPVPGRMERVDEGQPFVAIVDYAYEPAALAAAYDALGYVGHRRVIHVVGSAGGGRDCARRAVLGRMAAERADVVIVTNEDPYDEDPLAIIREVADGARELKTEGEELFVMADRREAIRHAVDLAESGDLVFVTGKGSEPVMAVAGGKTVPWDDRQEVRDALRDKGYARTH